MNMYNNPYSPYGMGSTMPTATQPYGYPMMPYMNQPMQNSQPQQQINTPINTNKIYVSGIEDVRTKLLAPNSEMLFVDNEKDIIYEKKVDNKGQFEVRAFDIVPHQSSEQQSNTNIDMSGYAKTDELQALQNKISSLEEQLSKLAKSQEVVTNGTRTNPARTTL